jgi:hypothetical protein
MSETTFWLRSLYPVITQVLHSTGKLNRIR